MILYKVGWSKRMTWLLLSDILQAVHRTKIAKYVHKKFPMKQLPKQLFINHGIGKFELGYYSYGKLPY